ncbi:MAG: DUF4390 domain-containing protein [Burkholderiaceae bacterium]|jgi:hypothetical protein|nr:DUF4390 domain-containing protein [Burkholderiaceae bacterium]
MVFTEQYWRKTVERGFKAALLALVALLVAMLLGAPARAADGAKPPPVELNALQVERDDGALLLSAQLNFALPLAVREALTWGVPVYFSAEADIIHPRWYWRDQHLGQARRYWRLNYLPLTRRWRLASSSEPLSEEGIGTGLAQHYDSLNSAVAALQRITGWRVADTDTLAGGGQQTLIFSFQLDTSQLPRALQIGTAGQPDWRLRIERRIDLTRDVAP